MLLLLLLLLCKTSTNAVIVFYCSGKLEGQSSKAKFADTKNRKFFDADTRISTNKFCGLHSKTVLNRISRELAVTLLEDGF